MKSAEGTKEKTIEQLNYRTMKKLIIISLLAILAGCYYDNEEELYPSQSDDCDTTNVIYSGTIFPIINSNCIGCHSGSAPQGNVLLEDYPTISAAAAIPAGTYGSLYGAISHASGNSPMPKNGAQLSDCKIKQVKAWIDAGRPDN
jgi:mono/diheme cytochrome c family protein